jgi:hypothetical protein
MAKQGVPTTQPHPNEPQYLGSTPPWHYHSGCYYSYTIPRYHLLLQTVVDQRHIHYLCLINWLINSYIHPTIRLSWNLHLNTKLRNLGVRLGSYWVSPRAVSWVWGYRPPSLVMLSSVLHHLFQEPCMLRGHLTRSLYTATATPPLHFHQQRQNLPIFRRNQLQRPRLHLAGTSRARIPSIHCFPAK